MSAYDAALTEDTLVAVADRRARGLSWEATARELGLDAADLRRAVRREPEFDRYYDEAAREVNRETEAEVLLVYRTQLRDPDAAVARKAADALAKHLAGDRRDRTRLEVEHVRAGVARAKLDAKRAAGEPEPEPPVDLSALPPEQVHTPHLEAIYARRAADGEAVVWLWGGAHKLGDTPPDPATDVPLVLTADHTLRGRHLYWAMRFPLAGNPMAGPFPVPGGYEPVPELTPEQARQVESLATKETADVSAA